MTETLVVPVGAESTSPPQRERSLRVPRPPRRPPSSATPRPPLGPTAVIVRGTLIMAAVVLLAFVLNATLLSHLHHAVTQQQLSDSFRLQLSEGTAPVSEGDFNDVLLADGAPVAIMDIPSIGVHEVVAEGTSSGVLTTGPGHRRDSVLPGQAGVSVLMGRAASYGGPFSRLQELAPGDRFTVITGQGTQDFEVVGVRYAGDPSPASPVSGESRLILETARGAAYVPSGIAYVDAELMSETQPSGARQSTFASLPPQDAALATDTSTIWALVFAIQFLLVTEIAAVWAIRRVGAQKTWIVFVPLGLVAGSFVGHQLTLLLPNLL
ncbi:MAG: sortase [Burkholderiaceae bacterium]|nr:sortase [Microbacteriaceae bacterium]